MYKNIIKNLLIAFVFISVGFVIGKDFQKNQTQAAKSDCQSGCNIPEKSACAGCSEQKEKPAASQNSYTTVYYFHGNKRCHTCQTIEKLTKSSLDSNFTDALKTGTLRFVPINLDQAENEHFIQDFQLTIRTVVVAKYNDEKLGTYRDLSDVWVHVKDEKAFEHYIKTNVSEIMTQGEPK